MASSRRKKIWTQLTWIPFQSWERDFFPCTCTFRQEYFQRSEIRPRHIVCQMTSRSTLSLSANHTRKTNTREYSCKASSLCCSWVSDQSHWCTTISKQSLVCSPISRCQRQTFLSTLGQPLRHPRSRRRWSFSTHHFATQAGHPNFVSYSSSPTKYSNNLILKNL